MNSIQHFLACCGVCVTILSLTSCSSPPVDVQQPQPLPTPEALVSPQPSKQAISPANTIPVTIYQVDSQCSELVPTKITVAKDKSLEDAIAQVLEQQNSSDFTLNYRVNRDSEHNTVTIDFRVPSTAQRTINSLSSCEQLALFGSLRKTLTTNPDWQINEVYFTERGEEIAL